MSDKIRFKISVQIKEDKRRFRLLIVERRDFDIYCFIPYLGTHYSFHETGEIHFKYEQKALDYDKQPPVILMPGQAGIPIYTKQEEGTFPKGWKCNSIRDLSRADGIFIATFAGIESLSQNYEVFNGNAKECFLIDKDLLPQNTNAVEIGVWAIPARNSTSFYYDHPNIPPYLLYKIEQYEPQIWIYVEPESV